MKHSLFVSSLLALSFSAPLAAQTPAPAKSPPAPADADLVTLDTIAVSATRTANKAFDVPGMVAVIDLRQLEAIAPASMGDILKLVPGVDINGGPRTSGESLAIRGKDDENLVVLLDGARQNFNALPATRFYLEPDLLKSVEVVRGPNSGVFGNGGLGGVIALETKDAADLLAPAARFGLRLKAGARSGDESTFASATVAARPTQALDLVASTTVRESEDIRLGTGLDLPFSAARTRTAFAKGKWTFAPGASVAASVMGFTGDEVVPANPTVHTPASILDRRTTSFNYRAAVAYAAPGQSWFDFKSVAYATDTKARERAVVVAPPATAGTPGTTQVRTRGFDAHNTSTFTALVPQRLTYGFDLVRDRQQATALGLANVRIPNGEVRTGGFFVQDEIKVAPTLTVIPTLRYDDYEVTGTNVGVTTSDRATTAKLGATWKPAPWFLLFALYSEGFQSPDIGELFRSGFHFRVPTGPGIFYQQEFVPNPALRPEQAKNYEGGFGVERSGFLTRDDHFHFKLSLFETAGKDTIESKTTALAIPPALAAQRVVRFDAISWVNLGSTTARGAEAELGYTIKRFYLRLGYSTMIAKDDATGARLNTTPGDKLVVQLAGRVLEDLTLGARTRSVGGRHGKVADPNRRVPGYTVADLFVTWRPRWLPFRGTLELGADNLTDKAYATEDLARFSAGRTYKAAFTASF